MAKGLDHQWVADLVEVQTLSRYNQGYHYLLTVIDILSKYAWVQPLKDKTGVQLVKAFEKILKTGRPPYSTTNRSWQRNLQQNAPTVFGKIHHFSTHGDAKASMVERFNCTLKTLMHCYFTLANTALRRCASDFGERLQREET